MEPDTPLLTPPSPAPPPYVAGLPTLPTGEEIRPDAEPRFAEPAKPPWLKRRLGPVLAAIAAFAAKFKAIILLLPKIKILASLGTMAVSLVAYGSIWGFTFAAGFIALLFVHEMGHVIQLRREGIKASAPMFIPFLGAVVTAKTLGENALAEARVGLAGPVLGSIGAVACVVIWQVTGNEFWRAIAYTGFFLNLFNLLPVVPLDGGRAMAAMSPWMWFVGFAALVPLVFLSHSPMMVLILLFAAIETMRRWRLRREGGEQQQSYYRVKGIDRLLVAGVYLGLVALLVVGMHATNLQRTL